MPIKKILIYPNEQLKKISSKVDDITDEVRSDITDLVDTLKDSPGVGLAAPQINIHKRIIAIDITEVFNKSVEKSPKFAKKNSCQGLMVLINPVITKMDGEKIVREGCLSVPEYTANVKRAKSVTVTGLNPDGENIEIEAKGFEAVCFQHEIDHLDGLLFLDRIESTKTDLFRRR